MTIAELRDLADGRGVAIPVGPKAAIIEALLEAVEAEAPLEDEQPEDEEPAEVELDPEPELEQPSEPESAPRLVQAGGWVIGERGGWVPRAGR
jgi:hypothetical protein